MLDSDDSDPRPVGRHCDCPRSSHGYDFFQSDSRITTFTATGEQRFEDWGWRLPFLFSVILLVTSIWVRLKLNESPLFRRMKESGQGSKSPLKESFAEWANLKLVLIALFGATAGQSVVFYGGQFNTLFFLTQNLKVSQ
jgi:MFS family permease